MGQSIDCQPHFGYKVRRRKTSYANHVAKVGEKSAVCLLREAARWLDDLRHRVCQFCQALSTRTENPSIGLFPGLFASTNTAFS